MNTEKTHYETNPVETTEEAIIAFVEAYDGLQKILSALSTEKENDFANALRNAMYRPVYPKNDFPAISLYEIGMVYENEKYTINKKKLNNALENRESDIHALFVQENGILPKLTQMLHNFLFPVDEIISETEEDFLEENICDDTDENISCETNELIQTAVLRFYNECRRLIAMLDG